jgi:hypothetical protein
MADDNAELPGEGESGDSSEMASSEERPGAESVDGDAGQDATVAAAGNSNPDAPSLKSSFTPGQPASTQSKILVVLFATTLIVGGIYVASPDDNSDNLSHEREGFDEDVNRNMDLGYKSPFLSPGINKPEVRPSGDVRFAAASPVIGVSVGESHRAYPMITLLGSFTTNGENGSIVNDTLGGKLITVTNDGDSQLVRVFQLAEGSRRKTIGLILMGMGDGGGMNLTFDTETTFPQNRKEIPDLTDHPFKKATLAEWLAEHPDTDVYVGEFVTADLQMESSLPYMTPDERLKADGILAERNRKRKNLSPTRKKRRGSKSGSSEKRPGKTAKPEKPAEKKPAEKKPAEKKPAEKKPTGKAAGGSSGSESPSRVNR